MVCTDRVVDLVDEGYDLAIGARRTPDSYLIARRIGTLHRFVVASPAYRKDRKPPKQPTDLINYACISFCTRCALWALQSKTSRSKTP